MVLSDGTVIDMLDDNCLIQKGHPVVLLAIQLICIADFFGSGQVLINLGLEGAGSCKGVRRWRATEHVHLV